MQGVQTTVIGFWLEIVEARIGWGPMLHGASSAPGYRLDAEEVQKMS
jgi:hypothetical protein